MLDVQALTKLYGSLIAVDKLTFRVSPGEILGLVGPNGAGKTTTLRCIAGIITPTSGTVRIGGHDIATEPKQAKTRLAFIPDEPQLFEYLTVEEHLRFIARLYGVGNAEERIPPVLESMELVDKRRSFPSELSRGMRQKLAIACGLLHDPSALILDEPLTGLDPAGIRKMKTSIKAYAAGGTAVILSSHLLHLVEELCTSLLIIRAGRLVAFGTIPQIIAERPELADHSLEDIFLILTSPPGAPRL